MAPEHLGIRSRTVAGRCSWRRRILGGQESAIAEEEASLAQQHNNVISIRVPLPWLLISKGIHKSRKAAMCNEKRILRHSHKFYLHYSQSKTMFCMGLVEPKERSKRGDCRKRIVSTKVPPVADLQ